MQKKSKRTLLRVGVNLGLDKGAALCGGQRIDLGDERLVLLVMK